ncbi:MAG: TMEM14 family protein [Candidatus Omnitrophica bacterium]|nr:TMEM14 family protein [Candidatus Omnitrophota bacterium]
MTAGIILTVWGLLLILGVFLGFKKGSKVSLIAGASCGILVFLGIWILSFAPKPGWVFLSCLNFLLSLNFLSRLLKTKKFMPSGMLLILTLAVLIFCLAGLK